MSILASATFRENMQYMHMVEEVGTLFKTTLYAESRCSVLRLLVCSVEEEVRCPAGGNEGVETAVGKQRLDNLQSATAAAINTV